MIVRFPYKNTAPIRIENDIDVDFFNLPEGRSDSVEGTGRGSESGNGEISNRAASIVRQAMENPIGSDRLREIVRNKKNVLIVVDDNTRPTPIDRFVKTVLEELHSAEIENSQITFMIALGTHRPMSREEMVEKLGEDVVDRYACLNHDWENPDVLVYLGDTKQGAPVWINRRVIESDLVIGLGSIMPIDICGFTGGGKILVPGLSGPDTVNKMHWTRVYLPSDQVVGREDNPIRESIDTLARKAGLDFIVNVLLDSKSHIVDAVAGDMTLAHREGCHRAAPLCKVEFRQEYDIVITDSHPFDIEFWQANKALDSAGHFVRKGGVIILVTPCPEGWSKTHRDEIVRFGYPPTEDIKKIVEKGELKHSVVGVHMHQVGEAAVEKGRLILVSEGLPKNEVEKVGFEWAESPTKAFIRALEIVGESPAVAILSNAASMIPTRVELEAKVN